MKSNLTGSPEEKSIKRSYPYVGQVIVNHFRRNSGRQITFIKGNDCTQMQSCWFKYMVLYHCL